MRLFYFFKKQYCPIKIHIILSISSLGVPWRVSNPWRVSHVLDAIVCEMVVPRRVSTLFECDGWCAVVEKKTAVEFTAVQNH